MGPREALAGGRLERKKEETKRKIISTAMQLFREHGFDATTMEQIAAQADIAKGTLYNYFPVKEAILSDYMRQMFEASTPERLERLKQQPSTRARLVMTLRELMAGVRSQPLIFERYHTYRVKAMISLEQDETMESGIGLLTGAIIQLGQEAGEIRMDIPLDILQDLFEFAFMEVARQFYHSPQTIDIDLAIEQCVDLFINGAQPGRQNENEHSK